MSILTSANTSPVHRVARGPTAGDIPALFPLEECERVREPRMPVRPRFVKEVGRPAVRRAGKQAAISASRSSRSSLTIFRQAAEVGIFVTLALTNGASGRAACSPPAKSMSGGLASSDLDHCIE
jgi:hypothetical protein